MSSSTGDAVLFRRGTLAADLLGHRMAWVHARLEGLDQVPDTPAHRRLHEFVSLHKELLPEGHLHQGEVRCRPVPARRHFGEFQWFDPRHDALVGGHWPSFQPRPSSLTVAVPAAPDEDPLTRIDELGFPLPEEDPAMVIGQVDRPEGRTWVYVPGPGRLAELSYRLRRGPEGWDVIIAAERPPDDRYDELVAELHRAFGWEGTLVFPSGEAFREKDGDLKPPGSERLGGLT